jgi:beta-lactam-binding protein with PASTA domain
MIAVPSLESMSARRASLTLSKLNLKIDVRSVRMNGTPGVVIAQSPAFTTFAASGDVVAVCVRRAAIVPNVVGRTFEAGRSVLADSGFESIKTNSFVDDPSQVGVIIRQQPAAGVAAPIGSVDALIVGIASPIASVVRSQSKQEPPRSQPQRSSSDTDAAVRPQGSSRTPPTPDDDLPRDWSWVWKLLVGIGVVSAPWPAIVKAKDRRRLAALRVVPRQHPGRPRVVSTTRARDEAGK